MRRCRKGEKKNKIEGRNDENKHKIEGGNDDEIEERWKKNTK